ncbi:MAG: TolC family protein [Proteobacteria bacterium]|nr:TolC family protein [Pseudomonadota bacterium]MBU1641653.1 TolC family protein [Pseudomonadota bacterium]
MARHFSAAAFTCFLLLFFAVAQAGATEQKGSAPVMPEVWSAEELVRFALANNPDSKMARERIKAAEAAIMLQKASLYPSLSINSEYSQTDNAMYSFGNILNQESFDQSIDFNNPGRTDNLNTGVQLSYRLYNGGRDQAGLKAAESEAEAKEMELRMVHDRLALEVLRAFNLIIQADEMVKAHEAMVRAITASLVVAQARYEEGAVLRVDLLDLEVQRANSQENLIQARHGLELSRQILLNLLGLSGQELHIIPACDQVQQVPQNTTYDQRPELKSLDAMIAATKAQLRQANGGYLPVVDGYAGYGLDTGFVTDNSGDSWQAGIKLQYTLFDGHRTQANVAKAAAQLAEIKARRRKIELAIELEIKQANLALHEAQERMAVTEKTVAQAEESARINRNRFSEGLILTADLIAVEIRLTDAQIRRVIACTKRRIAVAELRRAMGLPQFDALAVNSVTSTQ